MTTEFSLDSMAYRAATTRGMLIRAAGIASLLGIGAAIVHLAFPSLARLGWSFALCLIAVYAAVEISTARWTRRRTPTMRIVLRVNELQCWIGPTCYPLAYDTLVITRIVQRAGQVRRIDLKTHDGGRLRLEAFQDMNGLAEAITAKLVETRADAARAA